jgi:hypothetical protein
MKISRALIAVLLLAVVAAEVFSNLPRDLSEYFKYKFLNKKEYADQFEET